MMGPTDIVLALIVEMAGLGIVVTVAGISDDAGTTVLVVMFGLWLLFLINHESVQTWLTGVDKQGNPVGLIPRIQAQLNGVR